MSIMIAAAALAAAQPATATPQPMPMAEHSADAMKDCCCKGMKPEDSGAAISGKDEQKGHPAH